MELRGKVVKESFGQGTKSERLAVQLVTPGGKYILRRAEGNAFKDPILEELVGKTIVGTGVLQGYVFIMSSLQEVSGD